MRFFALLLAALSLSCATLYGQTDGFHENRMAKGCFDVPSCDELYRAAQLRSSACAKNEFGRLRCDETEKDLAIVKSWLLREQTKVQEIAGERDRLEQSFRDEAERRGIEAREAVKQRQRANEEWVSLHSHECIENLDEKACGRNTPTNGDELVDTCRENCRTGVRKRLPAMRKEMVLRCTEIFVANRGKKPAKCTLPPEAFDHQALEDALREYLPACAEDCFARGQSELPTAPPPQAPAIPKSSSSKRVECCDGTLSPSCACGRASFQGCCSHHGGICGGCD